MLGHGYWQRRFGGDRAVIGRGITIDSRATEIVGVMPDGFRVVNVEPDVIVPFGFDRSRLTLPGFGLQAVARLKPGVTIAEASADVARMRADLDDVVAAPRHASIRASTRPGASRRHCVRSSEDVVGNVTNALWVLMGTIGIVMLIACANVASLLLVRTEGRQQELAVRAALGAGRGRIVRGLLGRERAARVRWRRAGPGARAHRPARSRQRRARDAAAPERNRPRRTRTRVHAGDFPAVGAALRPDAGAAVRRSTHLPRCCAAGDGRRARAVSVIARATSWWWLRWRWRSCCSWARG